MSMAPDNGETDPDSEAGKQAGAMKDRLRKDVAAWSAARTATHSRDAADASVPVPKQPPAAKPAAHAKRPNPAPRPVPSDAAKPTGAAKKPFRMSYDGVTEADYISYIIQRDA